MKEAVSHLENMKQLVSEVSWGHNILIMQKVKNSKARVFYLQSTIKNKYSRAVFILLIPHKDKLEVEYTLRTAAKPRGVAQYTLRKQLPKELHGKLPSAIGMKESVRPNQTTSSELKIYPEGYE